MARRPLLAANWKMNLDHLEATHLVQKLAWILGDADHDYDRVEVAVFPPFTDLRSVQTLVESDELKISYGAQDVSAHSNGAYTGEISAEMLAKLGVTYVIVGHSEQRHYHGVSNADVSAKAKRALANGITPILSCGEPLEVRQAGEHVDFVLNEIHEMLGDWSADDVSKVIFSYEPIWAVGTDKVATPENAQEVCGAIRTRLRERCGDARAERVRILYGGSANAGNIKKLMEQPDIDGALVGRAGLKAEEFATMAEYQNM